MTEYSCTTLANGLRVVSVPMPHHHSAEVMAYLGVGSRDETPHKAGVSHFLEHMLFKGTADYPTSLALERAFEAIGGSANAATDTETTCFHSRVHPDHVADGIDLLASMLRKPLFNDLDLERRVILEEALGDLNESGRQINPDNIVANLLFPCHPLGQPTVGLRHAIEKMSIGQIKRHFQTYYTPANMVLAVSGPVHHASVLAAAKGAFADWQGDAPPAPKGWSQTAHDAPVLRWVRDAGSQVCIQLAFLLPGRDSSHATDLRVLRRLLGWGGMSRLMLRLREELGLTYAVDANLALYADAGVLAIDLAVSPHNLSQAVDAVLVLISELHRDTIPGEELNQALTSYRYDLEYSKDQVDEMALRYAWSELTGCRRTIANDLEALEAVSAEGLRRTVRALLNPSNLRGAVVGPYRAADRKVAERFIQDWQP